jgi:TonB family protein
VVKANDPKGTLFGARDRYTILDVTLDQTGAISAMTVRRSSGLAFLDEGAMDAMRRAAPLGAPPPGLLGPNGTVQFPFGFYMEVPGSPPRCRPNAGTSAVQAGNSSRQDESSP